MVLVCVTEQIASKRLIAAGRNLADKSSLPLKVICVRSPSQVNWLASEEVEALFNVSKQLDAEMIVKFADDAAKAVSDYISEQSVQVILVGMPPPSESSPFIDHLADEFAEIPLIEVDTTGRLRQTPVLPEESGRKSYETGRYHGG